MNDRVKRKEVHARCMSTYPGRSIAAFGFESNQSLSLRHLDLYLATCHPTQVNATRLNPASKLVLDLPTPEGWKAELI